MIFHIITDYSNTIFSFDCQIQMLLVTMRTYQICKIINSILCNYYFRFIRVVPNQHLQIYANFMKFYEIWEVWLKIRDFGHMKNTLRFVDRDVRFHMRRWVLQSESQWCGVPVPSYPEIRFVSRKRCQQNIAGFQTHRENHASTLRPSRWNR